MLVQRRCRLLVLIREKLTKEVGELVESALAGMRGDMTFFRATALILFRLPPQIDRAHTDGGSK
jgi:hypothetical protein